MEMPKQKMMMMIDAVKNRLPYHTFRQMHRIRQKYKNNTPEDKTATVFHKETHAQCELLREKLRPPA
jgi:hypothetical protein